jgi:hypothetical protein
VPGDEEASLARAIAARIQGDDAQAILFWEKVAQLFTDPKIEAVGYEIDEAPGFDDVAVYYREPVRDLAGSESVVDFWQSKFRVSQGDSISAARLTNPEFIGASKRSLLQRLRDVQRKHAPTGIGARFFLRVPIPFDPHDPYRVLFGNGEGEILLQKLFTGGPQSKMGRLRAHWIEHLELDSEAELRLVLKPLRIRANAPALSAFREEVSHRLRLAGWKPYGDTAGSSQYDDLARKLIQQGKTKFTRDELDAIGREEGLIVSAPVTEMPRARVVGIRSFSRGTERMPEETDQHLCLLEHFDGRWPRAENGWESSILPAIVSFATGLDRDRPVHVLVSAHNTVAFAVGYALDSKSGIEAYPVQVSGARSLWDPSSGPRGPEQPWELAEHEGNSLGADLGVAISITHHIDEEVLRYVKECRPEIGRVVALRVLPAVGYAAVRGGAHAHQLAEAAIAAVRSSLQNSERGARVHIFASTPAGFMFLLGQRAHVLGPCALYEHDFQRERQFAYHPSASFPLQSAR